MRSSRIGIVGDILLANPCAQKLDPELVSLLKRHHLRIANLEGPLTSGGVPADKPALVRMNPKMGRELKRLGFEIVTLANNHTMDYGVDGLRDTLSNLKKFGIKWVGAGLTKKEAYEPLIVELPSAKIGILSICTVTPPGAAATEERPGIASMTVSTKYGLNPFWLVEEPGIPLMAETSLVSEDLKGVGALVARTRKQVDILIAIVHWGLGLHPFHFFILDYQTELSKHLIKMGSDVVVGTHPHALQPIKSFDKKLALLSLGNFIFHQSSILKLMSPYGALLSIRVEDARIKDLSIHPVKLDSEGTPRPIRGREARRVLEGIARDSSIRQIPTEFQDESLLITLL